MSAHRDLRRPNFDDAAAYHFRRLQTMMRDLERDWHAYKASRPATPSSAVTAAAGGPVVEDDVLAADLLRCSPRRLVCSLQHSGGRRHGIGEDDASSVGSVEVAGPVSSEHSSCSCPYHRARRSVIATESSLSPPARAGVVVDTDENLTNMLEGRLVTGHNNRVRFIALVVAAAVVVAMMAVVVENWRCAWTRRSF